MYLRWNRKCTLQNISLQRSRITFKGFYVQCQKNENQQDSVGLQFRGGVRKGWKNKKILENWKNNLF